MSEFQEELLEIAATLEQIADRGSEPAVEEPLTALQQAAIAVGKAWSGSWLGYQAFVYYSDLKSPPPGAHFNQDLGSGTGDWREFDPDEIERAIYRLAADPDLGDARALCDNAKQMFETSKSDTLSILNTELSVSTDQFIYRLNEKIENLSIASRGEVVEQLKPSGQFMTRDYVAVGQGFRVPPHISVFSEVVALRYPTNACAELGDLARQAGSHLLRKIRRRRRAETVGTNVFIGHGGSPVWRDLKDFVQDRLKLPWDEFNRVPVAGVTNIQRLAEMLDAAAIAFLVMTGEDEQTDGRLHARMNVVHEAGLFQGRLGFTRAIVLLEEGCEEFSNIEGLGQIRFPKDNMQSAFEEIRRVLEREGIISSD